MTIFNDRQAMIHELSSNLVIAEIGVFAGDFSSQLYLTKPKQLYLVDMFTGIMGSGDQNGDNFQFIDLQQSYDSLQRLYYNDQNVIIFKGMSEQFFASIPDDHLDVVYIDANHTYEYVMSDLTNSKIKVKNGGIIMGHDYDAQKFPGVYNAVNEFCHNNNLHIHSLTNDKLPSFQIYNVK